MFRVWGKIFKDNHMLRDTVVCDDSVIPELIRLCWALKRCVITFDPWQPIWLDPTSGIFNIMPRPGFTRTVLWKRLISTIWNFR